MQRRTEAALLDDAGARVHGVHMDEAAMAASGANLMDFSLRVPSAEAGFAHGKRIAPDLLTGWTAP